MFEGLSERLTSLFGKLGKRGILTVEDVKVAMRDIRLALLEADVALPTVKDFIKKVEERAVGQEVLRSVTPGQQVVKIVHETLIEFLGSNDTDLTLSSALNVIMLVGLQGSGKTTTTAKLALNLTKKERKKVLMASLDVARPGAQAQLEVLGQQIEVATLPIIQGQQPVDIAKRANQAAKLGGYDVLLLDTAGRLHIDTALMDEVGRVKACVDPREILLVADSMTGQDALNVATSFNKTLQLTGIILTRIDGDARGGAALSMRHVTGCPIKFLGTGENTSDFEVFHADRIANRILGMGDVVSLVEQARDSIEKEDADAMAKRLQKGQFDLNDLLKQLRQMQKMGGLSGLMGMLPGMGKLKSQMKGISLDDKLLKHQEAIILSMTKKERLTPKLIHATRKKRIAKGSGTSIQEVNKLLKQFKSMEKMMKKVGKMGKRGMMQQMQNMLPPGGGMPPGFKP